MNRAADRAGISWAAQRKFNNDREASRQFLTKIQGVDREHYPVGRVHSQAGSVVDVPASGESRASPRGRRVD